MAEFFAANFHHTKGPLIGRPFVLDPFQKDDLDLIYEVDEQGRRIWRTILYGLPRGQGKSPLAAGIGEIELLRRQDAPEIFVFAASKDQAGEVQGFAHDMPKGGPLEDYLDFSRSKGSRILCPSTDGVMRVLSADGDTKHGKSVAVGICDELHCFRTRKQEELYYAMISATHKREDSLMLIITTAGADKASLLGEKYEAMLTTHELEYSDNGCRVVGRNRDTGSLLIWRGAPEGADVADRDIWRGVNPASWIPLSELERMASELPASVFMRLYLNMWVLGENAAIQPPAWDACEDADAAAIEPGADVWLGIDIGEKSDTSSVARISPKDKRIRIGTTVFNPAKENLKTLLPLVEAEVRRCCDLYNVRGVGFDPWQFRRSAELLGSEGVRMVEVKQYNSVMVPASRDFFELVQQGTYAHDGDPVLRRHVLSCAVKQTSTGGWRLAKPAQAGGRLVDESKKIDAAISVVIGTATYHMDATGTGDVFATTW